MFAGERTGDGGTIRLNIKASENGWEIREERDETPVRVTHQTD